MASYTDQQPTRIYRREGDAEPRRSAIGNTQPIPAKKGLFEGISASQIIAGAAAAATSMVLASKLGWAGSVIGAAVSSVVTVISSQIYRNFLVAGAEKLKSGRDALGGALSGSEGAVRYPGAYDARATTQMPAAGRGARIAPAKLQARAAAERAGTQRKVIAFSILAAVLAVAVSAAIILATTAGEGLGEKAQPLFTRPETVTEPEEKPVAPPANDDASGSDGTTQPDAGKDADGDAPTSTGDGTGSTGTSGDNQSGTGSGSSSSDGSTDDGSSSAGQGGSTGSGSGSTADGSTGTGTGEGTGTSGSTGDAATGSAA